MLEIFFAAFVMLADGSTVAGSWETEEACRNGVKELRLRPEVSAISDCYRITLTSAKGK